MTLEELLKEQGLSDEQINAVSAGMKENKIYTSSEENLDVRYGKLKEQHNTLTGEHAKATELIEQLKKSQSGNEDLKAKIAEYEAQIAQLKADNAALQAENALKFALKDAGAVDVDYIMFKAREKGEIKLNEDGSIKGVDDLISGLKTQLPNMFVNGDAEGHKKLEVNNLPSGDKDKTVTKEQFRQMGYAERAKLNAENPELYQKLRKG